MMYVRSISIRARSRIADDRGATLVEYVLLAALIALVCVLSVTYFGNTLDDKFSSVGSRF